MKARQKQLTSLAVLVFSITASLSTFSNAETRYFLEWIVGQAEQTNSAYGAYTIDDRSKSRGIRGGFEWSNTFGLELGHTKYGEAEENYFDSFDDSFALDRIDTEAYNVGLRMRFKLGRVASLIARAGWAAWNLEYAAYDDSVPGAVYLEDDEGIDTYYGFALQFQPEDNFRIAVEYSTLDFHARLGAANTRHEIDNYAVSVGFLF